jgi:hypothetical protein
MNRYNVGLLIVTMALFANDLRPAFADDPILADADIKQLEKAVKECQLSFSTYTDANGFPRKHFDMPAIVPACLRKNRGETLERLLSIVKTGAPRDAHVAFMLALIGDGSTEGWIGLSICNYKQVDIPDLKGKTERQYWVGVISRELEKARATAR